MVAQNPNVSIVDNDTGLHEQPVKRNKYGAISVINEHGRFDSTTESERYDVLNDRNIRGEISHLRRQVKIEVACGALWEQDWSFLPPIIWKVDFTYFDLVIVRFVVEDWKSKETASLQEYKLKRQLFLQRYPNVLYIESGHHIEY